MIDPEVQWTAPEPLWAEYADPANNLARQLFRRPAILRFASDTFMNDFMSLLQADPARVRELRAQPETWRNPAATPEMINVDKLPAFAQRLSRSRLASLRVAGTRLLGSAGGTSAPPVTGGPAVGSTTLKLYQPAHQRYYLVAAGLVCRIPGQPDRHIETSKRERASYVIRRVVPPANKTIDQSTDREWTEYAFVGSGSAFTWQRVSSARNLMPNEEQNPLFGMNFTQDDGHRRRILAGLIPVGKREVYVGASEYDVDKKALVVDPASTAPTDPRVAALHARVTDPWRAVLDRSAALRRQFATVPPPKQDPPGPEQKASLIKADREQLQTTSWYVLLDLADFLQQYLKTTWDVLASQAASSDPLITKLRSMHIDPALLDTNADNNLFANTVYQPADVPASLGEALLKIVDATNRNKLESATLSFNRGMQDSSKVFIPDPQWPRLLFPFSDPIYPVISPPDGADAQNEQLRKEKETVTELEDTIVEALNKADKQPVSPLPLAAQPVMNSGAAAWFVIRCVFERPNCGRLQPVVIGDASEPFQMAGFFDPDAPARPIRIALPIDTTPAGLRKFDKNTAFMISDVLCGQINRAKGMSFADLVLSVLPWPFHKDLDAGAPDMGPCNDGNDPALALGMICSLSIPIITICALILLMIFVSLLDIIFHWWPFFILCFPLPKFKGKPS